jgi:phage shock protein PspC (stress-responsive transcriptional regulator)
MRLYRTKWNEVQKKDGFIMKEMLSTISPKVIRIMALLTALFFTMVYVLFIHPYSDSIYNEKLFSALAFLGILFIVAISYIIYSLIIAESTVENI